MTTEIQTSCLTIHDVIVSMIVEYMGHADVVNYCHPSTYSHHWGKYVKRDKLTEMIYGLEHERWGDITINVYNELIDISCYSNNAFFTKMCVEFERLIHMKINRQTHVLIIKEYYELHEL